MSFVDDIIASQRQQLAQAASGVANQAIAAGVAKAQQAIDQSSKRTIKNAVVAALMVAVIIGGARIAWGYAHGK